MEMICLWMSNWKNIDISFLCPVTAELQALHLSKYLTDATCAVCLCGYLVLSHKVNRGLWGSLIEILQARCVHIHRNTPRSRLAHKPHAVIIQLYPHSASSLARQPLMVQMHHRSSTNLCSSIQPQGIGCIKRELDLSDKDVPPLPLESWLALSFKDWRGRPVMLKECFHLRGMRIHVDGEMKGDGWEMQRTWVKFKCYCGEIPSTCRPESLHLPEVKK